MRTRNLTRKVGKHRDPVTKKEALALYKQADKGDWASAAVLGDALIELGHPEIGADIVFLSGQVMKGSTKESVASLRGQLANVLWLISPRPPRRRPCLPNRAALTRLAIQNDGNWRGVRRLWVELVKACSYSSWTFGSSRVIERALDVANDVLRGHGVEALTLADSFQGQPALLYVNAGDPYTDTLCYEIEKARFLIASWATFIEHWERKGRRFE